MLKNLPMASSFESQWIPIEYRVPENNNARYRASAIQIVWKNVTGTLNGAITIYAANDFLTMSKGKTIPVASESNEDDSHLIIILPAYEYIKLKFEKNGITGGQLSAFISYS